MELKLVILGTKKRSPQNPFGTLFSNCVVEVCTTPYDALIGQRPLLFGTDKSGGLR